MDHNGSHVDSGIFPNRSNIPSWYMFWLRQELKCHMPHATLPQYVSVRLYSTSTVAVQLQSFNLIPKLRSDTEPT